VLLQRDRATHYEYVYTPQWQNTNQINIAYKIEYRKIRKTEKKKKYTQNIQ